MRCSIQLLFAMTCLFARRPRSEAFDDSVSVDVLPVSTCLADIRVLLQSREETCFQSSLFTGADNPVDCVIRGFDTSSSMRKIAGPVLCVAEGRRARHFVMHEESIHVWIPYDTKGCSVELSLRPSPQHSEFLYKAFCQTRIANVNPHHIQTSPQCHVRSTRTD